MRILLLQDQVHLPSLGGGNKTARMVLEALARRGHACAVVAPSLTTRAGPETHAQFMAEMRRRSVEPVEDGESFTYEYGGVQVFSLLSSPRDAEWRDRWRREIAKRIEHVAPDVVVVSDDRHQLLTAAALDAGARVVFLAQTVMHVPFGPDAARPSETQTECLRRCDAIMVVGREFRDYFRRHAGITARDFSPPVYGDGPFPVLGAFDNELVTLINPCVEKGVDVLIGLALARSDVNFAAVPTWGADEALIARLSAIENVQILAPADDIDAILARTRVLLAPSMWPEAFGLVAVEAMLRGIPVMASNVGGLPEAKQGVDYVLPLLSAERRGGVFVSPPQDLAPWMAALDTLVSDRDVYERCSSDSRAAALRFVAGVTVDPFEQLFAAVAGAAHETV